MAKVTDPELLDQLNDYTPRPELVDALINQESGGNNNSVSPKGARGIAQVMPRTASNPGYGVKPLSSGKPEEQRRFASDYLGAMLKKYGGNEKLALAAYNAGPGAVDAHGDVPPFPETQHYVKSILSALNPIKEASANEAPYKQSTKVTDHAILAELNGDNAAETNRVTDPKILAELNGTTEPQKAAPFNSKNALNDVVDILGVPSKVALHFASGITSGVAGGAKELYSLASGGSGKDAETKMRDMQQAGTYAPTNGVGGLAINAFDSPKNPINWPGQAIGALTDSIKVNNPKTGAAIEGAVGMSPLLMGGALLKKGTPQAAIETPNINGAWLETPKAAESGAEARSGGAAATPFADQARAAGVHEDIINAIRTAEKNGTLNEEAARAHIASESLPVPVHLTAGWASGDGVQLSRENNLRGTAEGAQAGARFKEANNALKENLQVVHDQAAPDIYGANHVDNGATMIDALKALHDEKKAGVSAKYKALEDMNGGNFPVNGQLMAKNALKSLADDGAIDFIPAAISKKLDSYVNGEPMSYKNYETFKTILSNETKKADGAIGSSRDGNAIHAIGLVRSALEDLPLSGGAEHLKPFADAARGAAREHFELIKKNPALNAAINDKIAPDDFIHKFILNGKVNDVASLAEMLKKNPEAAQTVASGTIQHLMKKAGIDLDGKGTFSQAGYNKALESLRPKLDYLVSPEIAEHLDNIGSTAFRHQYQPKDAFFNNSNTLVAGMTEGSKGIALKALNRYTSGLSGGIEDYFASKKLKDQVAQSLKPGAGLNRSDLPLNKHK
jgi:hypothetical protein